MKKMTLFVVLGVVVALAASGCKDKKTEPDGDTEAKAGAEVKAQTTCPVMGNEISKSLYADVKGKRVYVCCAGCIGAIKADPDKYIKKLEDDGVTLEKTPETKVEPSE